MNLSIKNGNNYLINIHKTIKPKEPNPDYFMFSSVDDITSNLKIVILPANIFQNKNYHESKNMVTPSYHDIISQQILS
jgi:hypothetical protein